ncbi:MAG: hypothetical protein GY937_29160 [bacterium]|nr:hypothetical protein [bacterium]
MHIQPPAHDHARHLDNAREQQGVERAQRGRTEKGEDTERAHRGRTEHTRGTERGHRRHTEHARGSERGHGRSEHAERGRLERGRHHERARFEDEGNLGRPARRAARKLHHVAHEVRHEVRSFLKENPELDDETRQALRGAARHLHEDVREISHELRHGGFESRSEFAEVVRGVFDEFLSGLREIQASLEAPGETGSEAGTEATDEADGVTTTPAVSTETSSQSAAAETAAQTEPTVQVVDPGVPDVQETTAASPFEGLIAQFQQQADQFESMLLQFLSHARDEHEEPSDDPATALELRIEISASIFARYSAGNLEPLGNRVDATA